MQPWVLLGLKHALDLGLQLEKGYRATLVTKSQVHNSREISRSRRAEPVSLRCSVNTVRLSARCVFAAIFQLSKPTSGNTHHRRTMRG